jgi:hypothetical protein
VHRICPGVFVALAADSSATVPARRTVEWIHHPESGPLGPSIEACAYQTGRDVTPLTAPPSTSDGSHR